MPSNVIHLNVELEAREDSRALTPKQEMTIQLRNDYNKKAKTIAYFIETISFGCLYGLVLSQKQINHANVTPVDKFISNPLC